MDLDKEVSGYIPEIEANMSNLSASRTVGGTALTTEIEDFMIDEDRYDGNTIFSGNPEDSAGLYLNGIGVTPLLNAKEEIELAKQIRSGRELADIDNPTRE